MLQKRGTSSYSTSKHPRGRFIRACKIEVRVLTKIEIIRTASIPTNLNNFYTKKISFVI